MFYTGWDETPDDSPKENKIHAIYMQRKRSMFNLISPLRDIGVYNSKVFSAEFRIFTFDEAINFNIYLEIIML